MKKVELYKHNKTTYDNITRIFETGNRCAVVQPTGSGKSFLIFKLAQDNPDKKIVVFEPNRYIISRVSKQNKEYGITNIEFLTYQKLIRMTEDEIANINTDYICLDELHRTGAKEWGRCTNTLFKMFPDTKFLGLTATPQRTDGVNIIDDFGAELACNITLGDAIIQSILPTPTYISALYTFDDEVAKVEQKISECTNSEEEKADMRKQLAIAKHNLESSCGVSEILKKHIPSKVGKYIVFCQNIAHLDSIRPVVLDWFKLAGYEVTDYVIHRKNTENDKQFKAFDNDNSSTIRLLFCVSMLNEGVHLDNISGVIMLRPTTSNIVYFQQLGRAIDAASNNIPLIFDLVNNADYVGYSSLVEEIEIAVERNKAEDSESCGFDINDFHVYGYISDCVNVLTGIESRCVDDFNFRLKQLEEYKIKWGHCCVMAKEAEEWEGLCRWAKSIRKNKNQGNISKKRLNTLNQYGFIWNMSCWKFEELLKYIKQYIDNGGSLPIPQSYICEGGFKLGIRIANLKYKNLKGLIPDKYINEFISLGIDLNIKGIDEQWMGNYNTCLNYIKTSNKNINASTIYNGCYIGQWLFRQRVKYRQGKLSKEKINLLMKICNLNDDLEKRWMKMYTLCEEYHNLYGKIPVVTVYKNEHIGSWLSNQKQAYIKSKLTFEQMKMIEGICNMADYSDHWNYMFNLCKEYISLCRYIPPSIVYKNENIGEWVQRQRQAHSKGKLTLEREKLLSSINVLVTKRELDFRDNIVLIEKLLKRGEKICGKTIVEGNKIGLKIYSWRSSYKKGTFPEEHYQQLLSLGIDLAKKGSLMADPT